MNTPAIAITATETVVVASDTRINRHFPGL